MRARHSTKQGGNRNERDDEQDQRSEATRSARLIDGIAAARFESSWHVEAVGEEDVESDFVDFRGISSACSDRSAHTPRVLPKGNVEWGQSVAIGKRLLLAPIFRPQV